MGIADVKTSEFFEDNEFFADMGNAYFFQGRQIIKPEFLQEGNKEWAYTQDTNYVKTTADSVKKYFDKALICIYVLEHQKHIDYHMVLRNMLSTAMEYQRQWKVIKNLHEKQKDLSRGNEFISGMKKSDCFTPVITLIVYYGEKKWDAAKSLHDLLDTDSLPEGLKSYISDYHIHVFDYHDYDNFDMFHTELKQVFSFLKYSSSKKDLQKLIAAHPEEYTNLSREACGLISVLTKSQELLKSKSYVNEETGGINVCKAFEEMRQEGIQEGRKEGIREGRDDKTQTVVRNMLKRSIPIDDICALAECTPEFVAEVRSTL